MLSNEVWRADKGFTNRFDFLPGISEKGSMLPRNRRRNDLEENLVDEELAELGYTRELVCASKTTLTAIIITLISLQMVFLGTCCISFHHRHVHRKY